MLTVQTWDQPTHLAAPKPAPRQDVTGELELKWVAFAGEATLVRLSLRKRLLDIIGAAVLSIISLPIVVLLALGSAVAFRAWPFFCHQRVGTSGELFRFLKVRSMSPSSPRYANKYSLESAHMGRWGKFLRSTHLDELPQLWLVLFGRMSLVGPRPEMPELLMSFDREFVERRLSMPQGCTGLWQVSARNVGLIGEAPELDTFYVSNWTLRLDLWILWRTVLALGGRTISGSDQVPSWCLQRGSARS